MLLTCRRAVSRAQIAFLTTAALLLLLGGCSGSRQPAGGGMDESNPASAASAGGLDLLRLNAVGEPVPDDAGLRLAVAEDGGHAVSLTSSPGQSLYLEIEHSAREELQVELAPALQNRALLFSQRLDAGLLQLGLAMLGEHALPANTELLRLLPQPASGGFSPAQTVKSVSAAPATPVADLHFDSADITTLSWTYYNNGDYDQNGLVTVGDITPVGLYFGRVLTDADWNEARAADGDLNGAITVSDLTPIGVNFNRRVDRFAVRESAAEGGPYSYVSGGTVLFSSAPLPGGGGPREFAFVVTSPTYENYYIVAAYDGENQAEQHSNAAQFLPDNLPPVVNATRTGGDTGKPGLMISFDASASLDPDGAIDLFEWDPQGSGDWIATGTTDTFDYYYGAPGEFTPRVRVTDDEGLAATASLDPLTISFGVAQTVAAYDGGHASGNLSAGFIADGRPAVSYAQGDGPFGDKQYLVRATTIAADNWEPPIAMLPAAAEQPECSVVGNNGEFFALTRANDDVYLADFKEGGAGDLDSNSEIHNHPTDSLGFGVCAIATPLGVAAAYASKDAVDEFSRLYFVGEPLGFLWFEVTLTSTSDPSLAWGPGRPIIAYTELVEDSKRKLMYQEALVDTGGSWGLPVEVVGDKLAMTAERCLLFNDNRSIIVFWSDTDNALYSVTSAILTGTSWADPVVIDPQCQADTRFSLKMVNGLPAVVYPDGVELKYAVALDGLATGWHEPVVMAQSPGGFGETDLLDLNGAPLLFYVDHTDSNLRVVVYH